MAQYTHTPADNTALSAPRTDAATFLIGDIHGRADLLDDLLNRIDRYVGNRNLQGPHLVFCGDFIDRGPQSAAVLDRVREMQDMLPGHVHCLMGNHERMLLDFLDDPQNQAGRWLRYGGIETIISYEVSFPDSLISTPAVEALARDLTAAMERGGRNTVQWLRALPLFWQSGNVVATHAGADPNVPIGEQSAKALLWGTRSFATDARRDGLWVAHGHTVVETATIAHGRISLDTGAVHTGVLSAVALVPGERPEILTTNR